jgi:hypothetical protein
MKRICHRPEQLIRKLKPQDVMTYEALMPRSEPPQAKLRHRLCAIAAEHIRCRLCLSIRGAGAAGRGPPGAQASGDRSGSCCMTSHSHSAWSPEGSPREHLEQGGLTGPRGA